jgi:hypothetical protein
MGRPRKWRPPPKPVGRPKKVVSLTEQLAKMSEAELIELQRYQQSLEVPKSKWKYGDIHPKTGKYFLWYQAKWTTKSKFEEIKKQNKEQWHAWWNKKQQEKELMNADKPNTAITIIP